MARNLRGTPSFFADYSQYARMNHRPSLDAHLADLYPILLDKHSDAGTAGGHYFHQDLWAARKVFERKPPHHVDIGSRIDGFIAHLLTFMPVDLVDIRPLQSDVHGLRFIQDDATELKKFEDASVQSLSSLHAAEHFGLGRYSDSVDPEACFRFMHALSRVLARDGRLYFSVPIGRERVEFNAHRVFDPKTILRAFSDLKLVSFALIDDTGAFHSTAIPQQLPLGDFACGLFEFTKL